MNVVEISETCLSDDLVKRQILRSEIWRRLRYVAPIAICLPPLYLLAVIVHSAVIYPYWDDIALVPSIGKFLDGTLGFSDLVEWHSQSRPLFPRLLFVLSAAVTQWDKHFEFVYLYLAILAILGTHLLVLFRLSTRLPKAPFVGAAILVSILICSPGGQHLHWYSLMLIPWIGDLFALLALVALAYRPAARTANAVAAGLAWLSTWSLSNGLLLFPAAILTLQLSQPKWWLLNRRSFFWLVNMAVCYALYLPGLPRNGAAYPLLSEIAEFVVVYLGMPLAYLIWYPVGLLQNPNVASSWPAVPGAVLLLIASASLPSVIRGLREGKPEAFLASLFTAIAIGSAVMTAWGRAAGEYGLANAEASRYTVWSVYLPIGLLYWHVPRFAARLGDVSANVKLVQACVFCLFLTASAITFWRALADYDAAIELNQSIATAWESGPHPGTRDWQLYPTSDPVTLQKAKDIMWRHRLGPFRFNP